MDYPKIGIWTHGIDNMLSDDIKKCDFLYFFVLAGSMLEIYLKKNLSHDRVIPISQHTSTENPAFYLSEMIELTNFNSVLKKNEISHFILPLNSSYYLEKWAKDNSITLIESPFDMANMLDNKIKFNQFLSDHRLPVPASYTPEQIFELSDSKQKKFITQDSEECSGYGTNCFLSVASIKKYLLKCKNKSNLLIREYLDAPGFGISIFLDKNGSHFYSALRRQCYKLDKNGFLQKFLGLQWVPHDFFNDEFHKNINALLEDFAQILKNANYYGTANFDFIVYDNKVLFLECNSRFSSGCVQLFGYPELAGGTDSFDFFIKSFFDKEITPQKKSYVPYTNFNGSTLDIYVKKSVLLKKLSLIGTYILRDGKIQFIGEFQDVKSNDSKRFFLTHDYAQREQRQKDFFLYSIFSNFPIFDFITGQLNEDGRLIEKHFLTETTR